MAIEQILSEIVNEYEAELNNINSDYETQKNELQSKYENAMKQVGEYIVQQKEHIKNKVQKQAEMSLNLRLRKETLLAQQEILDKIFDEIKKRFDNISQDEYLTFLKSYMKGIEIKNNAKILYGSEDEKFVDTIKEVIASNISDINVNYEKSSKIRHGIEIRIGEIIHNLSLDQILNDKKNAIIDKISGKLFKTTV